MSRMGSSLSIMTYSRWIREARAGVLARVDKYRAQPVSDLQTEVSRLKRELVIACEDRDVLKKATAYLLVRAVAASRNSPSEVRVYSELTYSRRSGSALQPPYVVPWARRIVLGFL